MLGAKDAGGRTVDDALLAKAGDDARDARVGRRQPVRDHATQKVPALRLDHGVAVDRRREARPHRDDGRGHVARGAEVSLGEDGVDDGRRLELIEHLGLGVDDHGDVAGAHDGERLGGRSRAAGADALDLELTQTDGLAKRDGAPDAGRRRDIGHDDGDAGAHEPRRDTGGDIACTAYIDKHLGHTPVWYGLNGLHGLKDYQPR